MRWNPLHPPAAPPAFGKGKILPEKKSSWLSRLTIHWLGAFLNVGFSRPLLEDDFWELPASRHTDALASTMERAFYSRCPEEKQPMYLRSAVVVTKASDDNEPRQLGHAEREVYDESLFKAILKTFKKRIFWSSVLLLVSNTLRTMIPLVIKVFLTWLIEVYVYHTLSSSDQALAAAAGFEKPRGVGFGVGLAFIIFGMQVGASLMANHFFLAAMTTGLYVRTGLIGAIFRKSLRLSGKARMEHTVGQVTTMISVDVTRLDAFAAFGPHLWSAPIQLILSIGLLIGNLGYSTLAGFAVMIVALPFQYLLVKVLLNQHAKGVKITDKRVRLTTEVLQGIRLIKVYGWESFYAEAIAKFRQGEIRTIKKSSVAGALLVSMFTVTPIIAIIMSFITYSLTGHDLNIAIIFTSLQLFNNVRLPLIIFPMVLSSLADAIISLARISKYLLAEELMHMPRIDPSQDAAVSVDGDFEWEVVSGNDKVQVMNQKEDDKPNEFKLLMDERKKKKEEERRRKKDSRMDRARWKFWKAKKGQEDSLPVTIEGEGIHVEDEPSPAVEEIPFGLKDLRLEFRKGAFVAIVGRVGSGKSSILQALIGEMRRIRGEVVFGGTIAYVPQVPWIKNATILDNILFGKEYDEERFLQVIRACSLEQDFAVLPQGKHTEIGEKGITLSGGQKARVSLARAVYSQADVVLLDDPLSAVDAYVGKSIVDNCLLNGPLATRTRVLVTHMLHVLDKTDYIYVMDDGRIIEQGSYTDLMSNSAVFRHLIDEYLDRDFEKRIVPDQEVAAGADQLGNEKLLNEMSSPLMEEEERNVGAVGWDIYIKYLHSAGGLFWVPIILCLLILNEAGNVAITLFLGFWTENSIPHFKNGHYMAVYGAIGGALALGSFVQTYVFIILSLAASLSLYRGALTGVIYSPSSFFDTTPIGRISSRLTKDQSGIDTQLPLSLLQFLGTLFQVFGTIALVFYTFPYLGTIFIPLVILYYGASVFYRRSSVETKRMDSILRSFLYASYSETLTGLSTIRAYSKQESSIQNADHSLDMQNRAYLMTVAMQRWLAMRLDFLGNILVLGIALFGATTSKTTNPAKTGVVLSYTLAITLTFAEIISLFANCEQEMNAVERVLHYAELPPEDNRTVYNEKQPPPSWPDKGLIQFTDVKMHYREGLPLVLKGINISIQPGEKIGIVGRTGSGKSSLIQALLRLVELGEGKIEVDSYDISHVDLNTLRSRMAFVPQDTTLFLGTLRDNLDPQRLRTDAELISVLQRAWLLSKDSTNAKPSNETKFYLDAPIGDEGSNYSAGEKQLLALGRALVKDSRIIILDEATSSVDVETDSKVQQTIKTEFKSATLICIAHRLNTIAHYDRILVMDDGHVAEFDTVLNLYDNPNSIFRALCEEASLTRADILRLRAN